MSWIIISISIILIIIYIYNTFIRLRNNVQNSWSGIDVQLKRRSDLIPNLIETVKGYATHEKELLATIAKARSSLRKSRDKRKMAHEDTILSESLKSLFAVTENYPKLQADQHFMKLQHELSETEDQIAAARRIYNENVAYYNTRVQSIPTNLIAKIAGFKTEEFFKDVGPDR